MELASWNETTPVKSTCHVPKKPSPNHLLKCWLYRSEAGNGFYLYSRIFTKKGPSGSTGSHTTNSSAPPAPPTHPGSWNCTGRVWEPSKGVRKCKCRQYKIFIHCSQVPAAAGMCLTPSCPSHSLVPSKGRTVWSQLWSQRSCRDSRRFSRKLWSFPSRLGKPKKSICNLKTKTTEK